ncbi:MAG TPA: class I SAM-dependent methyltransferase [Candidatus Sulfotelmatobacter sp.]|nr:class I SAM-dependent methyltransferase [Candidatus Sulfotelmatobacter sp.]
MLDATANLCECQQCSFVFDNPRPTIDALVAFYSQPTKYDSWLAEESARDALWTRRLAHLLPTAKAGSLLDVGTGIGQFLALARPHFSEVCGTEVSESAIQIARNKYGLELLRGEIQNINFEGKKFDNITLFHVLEHVPNPRAVIEKCVSLLSDGGILAVAVPNDLYTFRQQRFLRTILARKLRRSVELGLPKIVLDGTVSEIHLSHFTPEVLARLLKNSGLSLVANALDPYYAASGFRAWKHKAYYSACRIFHGLSRKNAYDAMLLVASKHLS